MLTVARGNNAPLELVVEPVTPEGPVPATGNVLVDILDPSDVVVVSGAQATEDPDPPDAGTARWTYDYSVAEMAPAGDWRVQWTATVNGEPVSADETFRVIGAAMYNLEYAGG